MGFGYFRGVELMSFYRFVTESYGAKPDPEKKTTEKKPAQKNPAQKKPAQKKPAQKKPAQKKQIIKESVEPKTQGRELTFSRPSKRGVEQ
tara:strand:+ start:55 stop:324 length:270 start_codon:yes stop_codon:yes gene_type:complete